MAVVSELRRRVKELEEENARLREYVSSWDRIEALEKLLRFAYDLKTEQGGK